MRPGSTSATAILSRTRLVLDCRKLAIMDDSRIVAVRAEDRPIKGEDSAGISVSSPPVVLEVWIRFRGRVVRSEEECNDDEEKDIFPWETGLF